LQFLDVCLGLGGRMSYCKKVILISEHFYPSESSTSYYLTNIAEALSEVCELVVVTTTCLSDQQELPFLQGRIHRLKGSFLNKNGTFSRAIKLLLSTFRIMKRVFSLLKNDDAILSVTNPAFVVLFLAILTKVKSFHYTLLVYDIFPENLVAAKLVGESNVLYKLLKIIFDWSYGQADNLIVIGRDMEDVVQRKIHGKVSTCLIPNWCDVSLIKSDSKENNTIIQKLGLENKFVCAFTGNLGRVQGIDNLLNAASLVKNENFVLLFIGDGAMRSSIEEYISKGSNSNVVYAGQYPAKDQNIFLNACDVAIVSLASSMYGLGVPSKSYYNMAAGKPLLYIGDKKAEIAQVVQEYEIGWVVPPENPVQLASIFEAVCEDNNLVCKALKSRDIAERKYSKQVILNKYCALYKD